MKINVRGDKVTVTKAMKDYLTEKLSKLNKYFDNDSNIECKVLVKIKNEEQNVEVTVPTTKFTLRAEEKHTDFYAAVDLVIDKLERQIRKNKFRLEKKYRDVPKFEFNFEDIDVEDFTEEKIVKRKDIEMKPMDEEEAIIQIELLNHDFFVFKNIDEDCVSVIYKRKDHSYGIINVK